MKYRATIHIQNTFTLLYLILMSKDKFDALTPEQREIVLRFLMKIAYERQRCDEYEKVALENIKNCGTMQYNDLDPAVKAEMVKACEGLKEMAYEKVTNPDVVDLLYKEVAKAKENSLKKAKKGKGRKIL